jgi:hypothetical protein
MVLAPAAVVVALAAAHADPVEVCPMAATPAMVLVPVVVVVAVVLAAAHVDPVVVCLMAVSRDMAHLPGKVMVIRVPVADISIRSYYYA